MRLVAEWKPGDRVWSPQMSKAGTVLAGEPNDREFSVTVRFDGDPYACYARPLTLEPLPEKLTPEPTASYYDFPDGHSVRHISAHLSSFGGQVVQYVARSTRLDGRNKGDVVRDLKAARDLLDWEIERHEATGD